MITIEAARREHIEALVTLESRLFAEDAGVHDPHADISWPEREGTKDFEQLLSSSDAVVLVAKRESHLIGFLAGYATPSSPTRQPVDYAVLRSLFIEPSARRLGAAKLLTEAFITWARKRSCVEVHVDHYAANIGARTLYESMGFRPRSVSQTLTL